MCQSETVLNVLIMQPSDIGVWRDHLDEIHITRGAGASLLINARSLRARCNTPCGRPQGRVQATAPAEEPMRHAKDEFERRLREPASLIRRAA